MDFHGESSKDLSVNTVSGLNDVPNDYQDGGHKGGEGEGGFKLSMWGGGYYKIGRSLLASQRRTSSNKLEVKFEQADSPNYHVHSAVCFG